MVSIGLGLAKTPSLDSVASSLRLAKLKPGSVVRCRTRRYLVEEVQPPVDTGADTVVAMACMEDQAIGQHLMVFLERESDRLWVAA